jgi:hypothetical protein
MVKKYIDKKNKIPLLCSKDKNIKFLGRWVRTQIINYRKTTKNIEKVYEIFYQ